MGTDNYREQARSLLNRNSHRLALRVVPLAFVAVTTLQAAAMFTTPIGNVSSASGFGTVGGSAGGTVVNGGLGVSLFGMGTLQNPTPGGNGLLFEWLGDGSGTFSTSTLPADWVFTISGPGASTSNWTLTFSINPLVIDVPQTLSNPPVITMFTGAVGSGGGTVNLQNQNINVPNGLAFNAYYVKLEVDTTFASSSDVLTVNVPPSSSVDINPGAPGVPEPASIVMVSAGLGVLLLARTIRKRA